MKIAKALITILICFSSVKVSAESLSGVGLVIGGGVATYKGVTYYFSPNRVLSKAGYETAIVTLQSLPTDQAKISAKEMMMVCQDIAMYFKEGIYPTADVINQNITGKFAKIDSQLLNNLQIVGPLIGDYIPSSDIFLTPDMRGYFISFFGEDGMEKGIHEWMTDNNIFINPNYTTSKSRDNALKKLKTPKAVMWFSAKVEKK
jgi:hypothetical protein